MTLVILSGLSLSYEWIFFLVTYIGPIIILTVTYSRIALDLWGQTGGKRNIRCNLTDRLSFVAIGEVTTRQLDSIQSKRKVVKMLIVVVVIFGVCW
jgi:tachykinin receptor 3